MRTAKLKLYYSDDIKRILVDVIGMDPLEVRCTPGAEFLLKNVNHIQIEFFENNKIVRRNVELIETRDNVLVLKVLSTEMEDVTRKDYRVDYKGLISLKKLEDDELDKFQKLVEKESLVLKSSALRKIKELLKQNEPFKSYIAQYLIELGLKIDKIISLLEKPEEKQLLETVKCVDIGGGGLCFFREKKEKIYDIGDKLYINCELNELGHFVCFSSIAEIVNKDESDKGYFYGVQFDILDADLREELISYILEKDRDLLRQFRLK